MHEVEMSSNGLREQSHEFRNYSYTYRPSP